jgi:hypothetical protein
MNRRDRRAASKKFGINKFKNRLPFKERMELMRQNIIDGKKIQSNMDETVRVQGNKEDDLKISNEINSLATSLAVSEGLSYIDAIEKAKQQILSKNK